MTRCAYFRQRLIYTPPKPSYHDDAVQTCQRHAASQRTQPSNSTGQKSPIYTVRMLKVHFTLPKCARMARQDLNAPAAVCAIARAGSASCMSPSISPRAPATTLVARASQSTANQTCKSSNPARCHHSSLVIGLLARLSGFDSQMGAHRSRKDPGSRGPFLPLHTRSHCHGKVTPASGCAHDGAQDGQPCRCFRELELGFFSGHETARRRIMCVVTVDGKHMVAFRGGYACMHACKLPGCHLRRTTAQGPRSHMGVWV